MRPVVKPRKPKHLMIKLHDDPALTAWTEHCAGLIHDHFREVYGKDEQGELLCSFFLHIAGDLIWTASKPAPCWSRFDVGDWVTKMASSPNWDRQWQDLAVMTLVNFYYWLVERGHMLQTEVATIVCQLQILADDAMRGCLAAGSADLPN